QHLGHPELLDDQVVDELAHVPLAARRGGRPLVVTHLVDQPAEALERSTMQLDPICHRALLTHTPRQRSLPHTVYRASDRGTAAGAGPVRAERRARWPICCVSSSRSIAKPRS